MGNHSESFYYDLALKWAPVNYHYINLSDRNNHYLTKRDLVVPVNLECYRTKTQNNSPQNSEDTEKCWRTDDIRNRLEALDVSVLTPVAYYSVAETANHFFVLYSFYHADDTTHPNDMEGCLVILEKIGDGDEQQDLLGMMTVAHLDFWKYVYTNRLYLKKNGVRCKANKMEVDEELESQRPLIQQEAGKHGLYALGDKIFFGTKIWRWFLTLLNRYPDIVVYWPGRKAANYNIETLARYKKTPHYPSLYYELVNILDGQNGLWHRKTNTCIFQEDGKFHGGKANPPWLWTESEFETPRLNMWESPAELVMKWFKPVEGRKRFDTHYARCMDGRMNCKCSDQQNPES